VFSSSSSSSRTWCNKSSLRVENSDFPRWAKKVASKETTLPSSADQNNFLKIFLRERRKTRQISLLRTATVLLQDEGPGLLSVELRKLLLYFTIAAALKTFGDDAIACNAFLILGGHEDGEQVIRGETRQRRTRD
jgi:hypothetical protein